MKLSTPSGRCGPCCSVAASGSTAIQRAVSAPPTSAQVISDHSRFGNVAMRPRQPRPSGLSCVRYQENHFMRFASTLLRLMAAMTCAAVPHIAGAQALDKVSFGTNWVAQAEHGGFYQALADGTYRNYGLDVTIVPGGPQINNRILLAVGKLDFFMSANTLQSFDAVEQKVPTVAIAAMFQKDPQVLIAHPDAGVEKLEDLRNLTLFVSKEGMTTYFQWLKSDHKFSEAKV